MSRRWVLQLGAGTVLTGFSGSADDGGRLPPGLYLPATNHLAHVIKAAASSRPLANYQPRFFNPAALELVRTVVAALLGDIPNAAEVTRDIANWIDLTVADSADVRAAANSLAPAHRAVAVQYYGLEAVRQLETLDAQRICREGLASSPTAESLVDLLHGTVQATPARESARRFLDYLKTKTIDGYYTSKEGLRELDFRGNSFYSEPPGCTHSSG